MKPFNQFVQGVIEDLPSWPRHIDAVDLADTANVRSLWRRRSSFTGTCEKSGRASPMGFWLTERPAPTEPTTSRLVMELLYPDAEADPSEIKATEPVGRSPRPSQTIRIKGNKPNEGDLTLTVSPERVRVAGTPAMWDTQAEPVLLAVCQYWRFLAIDAELDRLTELAERDVGHAAMAVPDTLLERQRLLTTARAVRTLLLDLPHFMGPLTDPHAYCTSDRSVQTYRMLAEKLHLEAWAEAIDERAEMVEDTYACVTEKLCEYRNFAWGAFLEITIIVILLVEVAFSVLTYINT